MATAATPWTDRLSEGLRRLATPGLARNLLVAAGCFGAGAAGHRLMPFVHTPVMQPSAGVALAAVLWGGRAMWPGVLAGLFLAETVFGSPWSVVFSSSIGTTLAVLAGQALLGRFGQFRNSLERVQDVLGLLYFGGLATAALSASLGVGGAALAGRAAGQEILSDWWLGWLRDGLSILTVTPVLLTCLGGGWRPRGGQRFKEALCLLALLVAAALLVFGENYPAQLARYSVAYVVFIFSVWSALRFGPRGAAATVFLVGALSLLGTARGFGPFAVENAADRILLWGVFNGVFAVCTLILAGVIAERRQGEASLQTSEARYRHLFSHAPISIWEEDFTRLRAWLAELRAAGVTDLEAHLARHPQALPQATELVTVTDINDVSLKMFHAGRREQLLGPLSRTLRRATLQFFARELLALWEGRTQFESEVAAHTLKGREIDYLLQWDATTSSGETDWAHVIVAITDITERSRLRDEFRQAQKMEAVGRLAGGIAHDFNNLIMTIQGYSSLLLARLGREPAPCEEAEQIQRAAERAAALTRQLLVFSRKQVMTPRVFDPNAVVADLNKMLRRLIGEHIHLEKYLAPDLGLVRADRGQIEQVVVNLAVNARDAMPKGGTLTLETTNMEVGPAGLATHTGQLPGGSYITLTVKDTGCGMPAAVKAHLFEPFFTTKGATIGTGLGLSTVYGIVKQCGGEIAVSSEEGQGAAFRIYLPRTEEARTADRPSPPPLPLLRGTEILLVVEDEDLVRGLLCKCLRSHGYRVLEAASGTEALGQVERAGQIDLLITDLVMPLMSGQELAHRLLAGRPRLKLLFNSGYTDSRVLSEGPWQDRAVFLEKPFPPEVLLQKVRALLDGTEPVPTAATGAPRR